MSKTSVWSNEHLRRLLQLPSIQTQRIFSHYEGSNQTALKA